MEKGPKNLSRTQFQTIQMLVSFVEVLCINSIKKRYQNLIFNLASMIAKTLIGEDLFIFKF